MGCLMTEIPIRKSQLQKCKGMRETVPEVLTAVDVSSVGLEASSDGSLFSPREDSPKRSGSASVGRQRLHELGVLHAAQAWWRMAGHSGRSQDGHFDSVCSAHLPRSHHHSPG